MKKAIFGVLNLIFGLNVIFSGLMAMEESQQLVITGKGVLPLKYLAADVYFKSMGKDDNSHGIDVDQFKEKINVQGQVTLDVIEQPIGKNAYAVEHEFGRLERVHHVIPELGQIITHNFWDHEYVIWHKSNFEPYGADMGLALTPSLAQCLSLKKSLLNRKWSKLQSITSEDFATLGIDRFYDFFLIVCDKDILIFLEKEQSLRRTVVLYTYKNQEWQPHSKVTLKHPIERCAYSKQGGFLACALENGTIVILRYDPALNVWSENAVIRLEDDKRVFNLSFIEQPYDEKPILVVHLRGEDGAAEYVLWHYIEDTEDKKGELKWQRIERIIPPENTSIKFLPDYARNANYITKEFNVWAHCYSPDFSRIAFVKDKEIHIYSDTGILLKTISFENADEINYQNVFFIDNETIVILVDYYDELEERFYEISKIISLKGSIDFSLCSHTAAKTNQNPKLIKALLTSKTFQSLGSQEQEHILAEIKKTKEKWFLKAKVKQLRKNCKSWAQNNPRKANLIKDSASWLIPGATLAGTVALHYKFGPKIIDFEQFNFNDDNGLSNIYLRLRVFALLFLHVPLPMYVSYKLQNLFSYLGL